MSAIALKLAGGQRSRWSPQSGATVFSAKSGAGDIPDMLTEEPVGNDVDYAWLAPVWERLTHILALPAGWDGPDSKNVSEAVAILALKTLMQIARPNTIPPNISPGDDGSLVLAWYRSAFDLEVSIGHHRDVEISLYDRMTDEEQEVGYGSPRLAAAIEQLAAS